MEHRSTVSSTVKLYTFTGPSGSGKNTIVRAVLKARPDLWFVPSVTTRKRRPSDIPGEYKFISLGEFEQREQNGEFFESITFGGNRYGTLKRDLERVFTRDGESIIILTPDAVPLFRAYTPAVRSFYIMGPERDVLRRRLRERGDAAAAIERCLAESASWNRCAIQSGDFDVFIRNDGTVQEAVSSVIAQMK